MSAYWITSLVRTGRLAGESLKPFQFYAPLYRHCSYFSWFWSDRDGTDKIDPVNGFKYIKEVYHSVDPNYSARFTIPVLYDKKLKTIVNNESSEIIRILNTFPREEDGATANIPDLYPEQLREEIDNINEPVYHKYVTPYRQCLWCLRELLLSENRRVHVLV